MARVLQPAHWRPVPQPGDGLRLGRASRARLVRHGGAFGPIFATGDSVRINRLGGAVVAGTWRSYTADGNAAWQLLLRYELFAGRLPLLYTDPPCVGHIHVGW